MIRIKWHKLEDYNQEIHSSYITALLFKEWDAKTDKFVFSVGIEYIGKYVSSLVGLHDANVEQEKKLVGFAPLLKSSEPPVFFGDPE